jgi:hypothetical protein
MWRRRPKPAQSAEQAAMDDVGSECDLFLAGRYGEHLRCAGRPVPSWAWVNRLAHVSMSELRAIADGSSDGSAPPAWARTARFLAAEILQRVDNDDELKALQRDVLVPLELDLAEQWFAAVAPGEVAQRVTIELVRSRKPRRS